jgi:hypothetical protein
VNVCDTPSAGSDAKFCGVHAEAPSAERRVPLPPDAGTPMLGVGDVPAPALQPHSAAAIKSAPLTNEALFRDEAGTLVIA